MAGFPGNILTSLPTWLVHSDWGSSPAKRQAIKAELQPDGSYLASLPSPVSHPRQFISDLRNFTPPESSLLIGFDFPIGIPHGYAQKLGVVSFLAFLEDLTQSKWQSFFSPAETADQISLRRPFYPARPGSSRQDHLVAGLNFSTFDDLRRRCERASFKRRAACPLFWTLGSQQVGKAALSGWRDVIIPVLLSSGIRGKLWPFHGSLDNLITPGATIIAETYPAQYYDSIGLKFGSRLGGKRAHPARKFNAPSLLNACQNISLHLDSSLTIAVQDGFGPLPAGEDRFDSLVGLIGMLMVLRGLLPSNPPNDPMINQIEGWILGMPVPEYGIE